MDSTLAISTTSVFLLGLGYLVKPVFRNNVRPSETTNYLVCYLFQIWFLHQCAHYFYTFLFEKGFRALLTVEYQSIPFIENKFIGYFVYDLVILLSSERGRLQSMYIIHHVLTLCLMFVYRMSPTTNASMLVLLFFILEAPSPFLNVWHITKDITNQKWLAKVCLYYGKRVYGLIRVIGLNLWFSVYLLYFFKLQWNHIICGLGILLIDMASIVWMIQLMKK